jgi:hypothetical protein
MDLGFLQDVPLPPGHLQVRIRIHPLPEPAERFPEPFEEWVAGGPGARGPRQHPGPGREAGPASLAGHKKVEQALTVRKRAEELLGPGESFRTIQSHQLVQTVRRKGRTGVTLDHIEDVSGELSGLGWSVGWVEGGHGRLRLRGQAVTQVA